MYVSALNGPIPSNLIIFHEKKSKAYMAPRIDFLRET